MNYKDTLFFVGKCLTISHEEENRKQIEQEIISGKTDWDNVVKLSTSHYVFPALYCNLKRANFLDLLPKELVNYMEHITNLNRERNQQIIEQAKEINELLLKNNVTPIFLKGTGNLLEGLYEDIAERMVGDIDFLVSNEQFEKAITILTKDGYHTKSKNTIDNTILNRHYPKITKDGKIGAVEIHYKMVSNSYEEHFNYSYVLNNIKTNKDKTTVLSYENQILMTCFNKQINDKGQWYKIVALRNSYDLFLLSYQASISKTLQDFKYYFVYLNNFLASTSMFFGNIETLSFEKTLQTNNYIQKQLFFIENSNKSRINQKKWELYFFWQNRLSIIKKSFYVKAYRKYLFDKISFIFKLNS